jgi:hypothetical protein
MRNVHIVVLAVQRLRVPATTTPPVEPGVSGGDSSFDLGFSLGGVDFTARGTGWNDPSTGDFTGGFGSLTTPSYVPYVEWGAVGYGFPDGDNFELVAGPGVVIDAGGLLVRLFGGGN